MQKLGRGVFGAATIGVCLIGLSAMAPDAQATEQKVNAKCPLIWAPVKCSNGKTYTNQCFATAAHATGCYPIGGPLP
jgi:hypothetical protein